MVFLYSWNHIHVDGMCWSLWPMLIKGGGHRGRGGVSWAVGSDGMGFKSLVFHFLKTMIL